MPQGKKTDELVLAVQNCTSQQIPILLLVLLKKAPKVYSEYESFIKIVNKAWNQGKRIED